MSYLENLESIIGGVKKSLDKGDVKISVTTQDQKIFENLEDIIKIVGNGKTRFGSLKKYTFILSGGEYKLMYFDACEFPSCCGKLIVHKIYLRKIYYESYKETSSFSDKQYSEMLSIFLDLLKFICEIAGYSSADYILSSTDNADLYEEHKKQSIKPAASWRNRRYDTGHDCNNYTIVL